MGFALFIDATRSTSAHDVSDERVLGSRRNFRFIIMCRPLSGDAAYGVVDAGRG